MPSRLVIGAGSTARAIIDAVSGGHDTLWVLTEDERRAETLRERGVSVTVTDSIDGDTLYELDSTPATVIVATDDPAANADAAESVADRFPDAFLLCYSGYGATTTQRSRLESVADRLIDPEAILTDRLQESTGKAGARTRKLQAVLRDIEGHLAIVTHDNPDPDAIASAVALGELASRAGCTVSLCYYGEISHQENRALVNHLEYDLVNLSAEDEDTLDPYDGFALVDHSRPGVNDQLPEDLPIDIVIDHHPPRLPVEARYVDLRSGVGATSTLLVDYFQRLNVELAESIATGLLFGIRVDTKDFQREVSADDFQAAAQLVERADMDALEDIEDPSISGETLAIVGRAIDNREEQGAVLLSFVGQLSHRDALAQAADRLLDLKEIHVTMVYGVLDGTIYISARARGADIDLGEALRDAFGQIGSAGGHTDMAGAQIELGVLDSIDDSEEYPHSIVKSVINGRFLDAVESRSHRLLGQIGGRAKFASGGYTELSRPPADNHDIT